MANGSSRRRGRRGGAVIGPGALSQRTDLNVSQQDARSMMQDETFGAEGELVEQVQQGNSALQGIQAEQAQEMTQPAQINPVDEFNLTAPTNYQDMPVTDTGAEKQTYLEDDSMMLIRAMAEVFPTDELLSLLMSQGSVYKQSPDIN